MMISLDKNNSKFVHHYKTIIILKELQNCLGEIYLGGKKTIATDVIFIITNIRIECQMNAAEAEGLLYNILSE